MSHNGLWPSTMYIKWRKDMSPHGLPKSKSTHRNISIMSKLYASYNLLNGRKKNIFENHLMLVETKTN